jgi:hypothetical protein
VLEFLVLKLISLLVLCEDVGVSGCGVVVVTVLAMAFMFVSLKSVV